MVDAKKCTREGWKNEQGGTAKLTRGRIEQHLGGGRDEEMHSEMGGRIKRRSRHWGNRVTYY